MASIFKEQLVKKEKNSKDTLMKFGIIVGAIIIIMIANVLIPTIGLFITLGVGYGAYWLFQRFNVEYEYIFTNGELDIDQIFNKSRRKRALTVNVKQFEIMAHIEDPMHIHEWERAQKVLDYSSGKTHDHTYSAIFTQEGQTVQLIFEPNDTILEGIRCYIPRQLHIKK
ncbi:MAG: hypothetical protein GX347_01630 [Epulopiscium sp.]|nr:hypothetical protein [Candidatus Epulonipiscium sp.]